MSCNIFKVNRSYTFYASVVRHNFSWHIPPRIISKKPFCDSQYRCAHYNTLGLCTYRGITTSSTVFQRKNKITSDPEEEACKRHYALRLRELEGQERQFYHNFLKCSSAYSGTIYKDDPQFLQTFKLSDIEYKKIVETETWNNKSPYDVITSFISLGLYATELSSITIEDQRLEALLSAFIEKLSLSTEDELINCLVALKYWPLLASNNDPQIAKVWKALDGVCLKRYLEWSIDKNLFMIDLWYDLGLLRKSVFVYRALTTVSRKIEEMTAAQMIQSLFYLGHKQNINPVISVREYEHYIQNHITNLSIEEIGIFALAFFKLKVQLLNKKILLYIMQRAVQEAEAIDSIVLSSISKIIRLSHKPDIGFTANDMVAKLLQTRFHSLPLVTTIHIVHIGTQIQFYNEEALIKLSEKFCEDPSKARLKEMERIVFFLSLYNFIPPSTPNVCHLIADQLNLPLRQQEAINHPLIFLSLLYFLSLLQVFPENQIRQAVNEKTLLEKYDSRFVIPQQTVQLDYNRVLEGPQGAEHLLSPVLREYLARRYSMYIPDKTRPIKNEFDKLLLQVMEGTDELLGKENNLVTYTLPHFPRADILFRLDDSGNPLPIPEEMRSLAQFDDIHRPSGPGKWYSVVIGGRNMYMHNVPRLVGEQSTKLRQLRSLGYNPIVIPSFYWKKEGNKMAYLKLKYFSEYEQNK